MCYLLKDNVAQILLCVGTSSIKDTDTDICAYKAVGMKQEVINMISNSKNQNTENFHGHTT